MVTRFKNLLVVVGLLIACVGSQPSLAQSTGKTFEGEFFTATVMNVAVAKKYGRVFITVLFRGKEAARSYNVALAKDAEKLENCATLLDNFGGQYVSQRCLPTVEQWYGKTGFFIKADIDSTMVFEFSPVDRSDDLVNSKFNIIIPFYLMTCKTYDNGCSSSLAMNFSQQSMSFFNLAVG